MVLMCSMQNKDVYLLYKSHQLHACYHVSLITVPNECLPCSKIILLNFTKFSTKNENLQILVYDYVTSYG